MKLRFVFTVLLVGALTGGVGCANLPAISARTINCPQQDVVVSDESMAINDSSWTATCRGWPYRCHGANNLVTCAPMPIPPPNGVAARP